MKHIEGDVDGKINDMINDYNQIIKNLERLQPHRKSSRQKAVVYSSYLKGISDAYKDLIRVLESL